MPLGLSELGSQGEEMGLWCLPHALALLQLFPRKHRSVVGEQCWTCQKPEAESGVHGG